MEQPKVPPSPDDDAYEVIAMSMLEHIPTEQLEREIAALPEARREKVRTLRRAIEEGRYRISSDVLAERLMEHMLRR